MTDLDYVNIPDEVKREAREYAKYHSGVAPVTTIGEKLQAAFVSGAEWARKEALEDAKSAALQVVPSHRPSGEEEVRGFADAKGHILAAIRALAEGESRND